MDYAARWTLPAGPSPMTLWRGLALLAIATSLVACAGAPAPPPSPPSEEAARTYLDAAVSMVLAGDWARICSIGSATCDQILRKANPAAVPVAAPTVLGSRVLEPEQGPDGIWTTGGRVLELCGRDGMGQPYYSEMLVFQEQGRLISTATPFWLGIGIAETPTVGKPPVTPTCG